MSGTFQSARSLGCHDTASTQRQGPIAHDFFTSAFEMSCIHIHIHIHVCVCVYTVHVCGCMYV